MAAPAAPAAPDLRGAQEPSLMPHMVPAEAVAEAEVGPEGYTGAVVEEEINQVPLTLQAVQDARALSS